MRMNTTYIGLAVSLLVISVSDATRGEVPQGFFKDVTNVGPVSGAPAFDFIPAVSEDGLTLYFSDTTRGGPIPGNHGEEDMWMATRSNVVEKFGNVVNLGDGVNTEAYEDMGSVSRDGLTLYFGSNRSGNWDLYQATRTSSEEQFGNVTSLGNGVNSESIENSPRVSPDGLTIVYYHDEQGDHDIWMATRDHVNEPFDNAFALEMNSDDDDWWPSLSSDGLTLFHSDWTIRPPRPGGRGAEDIWVSTRPTVGDPFGLPTNIDDLWPDSDINSSVRAGAPYISPDWPADGSKIYWTATGPAPVSGSVDIFQATWVAVPEPSTGILLLTTLLSFCLLARRRLLER